MLSITDAIYHKPHRMMLPAERLVKIRIVCSGSLCIGQERTRISEGAALIQLIGGSAPAEYLIDADNTALRMVVLHVLPEALQNLGVTRDVLPAKMNSFFELAETPDVLLPIEASAKLIRIALEILESRDRLLSELRQTYVRGKAQELLCEVMLRIGPVSDKLAGGNRFRQSDIVRLHEARRILASHLESSPTIDQLSRLVGINKTKLKAGFREFFGETIQQYRNRVRLEEALRLIEETELQMSEIGRRTGFDYAAHFSQAIKRHYGVSPRELRKRYVDVAPDTE